MKKHCIFFLFSIIITVTAVCFCGLQTSNVSMNQTQTSQYLRIHIRADSNQEDAQAVKYLVRDALVEYLTPIVAECPTKKQAEKTVQEKLLTMEQVADSVLQSNGFSYRAAVSMKTEKFPTRVYGEYTLPAGEYTALIIELGEGKGDNWWCVVYPPLCFIGSAQNDVVYKSKIVEIIESWKRKN